MGDWANDVRYGVRMIVKRPGTSAIAIVALGLGIGLTTVMFSIVEGVLLRGLPFEGGDRVMSLSRDNLLRPDQKASVPVDDFLDWQARQHSFEGLAAYTDDSVILSGDSGFSERYDGVRVSPNTMSLLHVRPVVGRDFVDADTAPGAPAALLLGHGVWMSRYGGDPSVVGRTLQADGTPAVIIGVMPEKFAFPKDAELWLPLSTTAPVKRGAGPQVGVVGLLKRGVSSGHASTELTTIAAQLALEHPENQNTTASFGPFIERSIPARVRNTLVTMLGAVFGVMLIACVNVTNLQLARAMERAKEVAIRSALGSSRWRIVRQLLVEGLVLSAAGSLLGLAIAQGGTAVFMRAIADTRPPFWIDVRLDPVVLLFVAGITVATALVSSVMPGWRVARTDVNAILNDETRGTTGLRMGVFSRWLVVIEVTASCVLLIVSGLMIRSILATSRLDYPFPTKDVFWAHMTLLAGDRPSNALALEIEQIEERVAHVPGVRAAALSTGLPGDSSNTTLTLEGQPDQNGPDRPHAHRLVATPGFFRVMRVAPVAGRLIAADDRAGQPPVAVVDQTFVTRYLTGGPTLGRRFRFGDEKQPWLTIIGIVPDLAPPGQSNPPPATAYVAMAQSPVENVSLLAWTANDPVSLTAPIRAAVAEINDRLPITGANSVAAQLWKDGWALRVFGGLFLVFGFAALVLASAGLYGVMAFSVRRRTQEIGVRMALGASRGRVLRMVLWQGIWRVAAGVALGLVPGWFVGTLMRALLEHVEASDPVVHTATVVTLLGAGVLACFVPALRAASVDPLTALRRD